MPKLPLADPEVAAATLEEHLDRYWAGGRPDALGITRQRLDALVWVVRLQGERATGEIDPYYLWVDGRYYDLYPVDVRFVEPPGEEPGQQWGWPDAKADGPWWPTLAESPPWLGLHATYNFQEEQTIEQLICFSMTAGYYRSSHSPQEHERWRQGRHTVAATLNRLHEILHPPFYAGPAAERT